MDPHFQLCADHLRQNDYGRYISCLFLEPEMRQAAFALYAFHSKIREIPALISDPMPGEIRIQWWVDIITNTGALSGDPLARALQEAIVLYDLPVERIERLLQTHIFDLYNDPIPDRQALETYLGETTSCMFLLLVHVANKIEQHSPAQDQISAIADACGHGGVFVGIAELLNALPYHEHRQQSYFPAELSPHVRLGEKSDQGSARVVSKPWLADIHQYSMKHHDAAIPAIALLPRTARILFCIMALSKIELERISRRGISLSHAAPPLSYLAIIWSLWKSKRKIVKNSSSQ